MIDDEQNLGLCPVCCEGHLTAAYRRRIFRKEGARIVVKLHTSVCDVCGETTTKAAQHTENLRILAETGVPAARCKAESQTAR